MKNYSLLFLRLLVAAILFQTLYFKFTAHPDSVHIFSRLGLEPVGRIGIGIMELIAGLLLLFSRGVWLGALIALGLMVGAIFFHLTQLGIEVNNDGGILFILAVLVFVGSLLILRLVWKNIPFINKKV